MPDDSRTALVVSTSAYSFARLDAPNCAYAVGRRAAGRGLGAARSSTSEFHAPHSTQRPVHFGACAPHSWQTKTTFGGFMTS